MASNKAERGIKRFQEQIESLASDVESAFDESTGSFGVPGFDFQVVSNSAVDLLEGALQTLDDIESIWDKCVDEAIEITIPELSQALDNAMESDTWPWPSGARDIVDTGALKNSKTITYSKSTNTLSIQYNEPYAYLVQYGGYVTSGYNPSVSIYMPPRPWVDAVLDGGYGIAKFPFVEIVEKRANEIFRNKVIFE